MFSGFGAVGFAPLGDDAAIPAAAGGGATGILRNQTRAIERGHSGVAAAQLGGVLA